MEEKVEIVTVTRNNRKLYEKLGFKEYPLTIDREMYTIFDLCSKETNVYTISNEIKIAYNNALNRLKKYEKQGFLIKSKIKGKNNRGVQTIYKLTPNGKKAYKIIKEFYTEIYDEKGNNISHLISKCNIY